MKLLNWVRQRAAYAQARRELNALSDRQLADMGLSRGSIDCAVRGGLNR